MSNVSFRYFFGGLVRLLILNEASQRPTCGVEIIKKLRKYGHELSPGTLYPLLHQLEEADFVEVESTVVGGKRRKNYKLTANGRKALKSARSQLRDLVGEIMNGR